MTILDYVLLGGFAAAFLYTGYRLFVGWLRTRSHEIENEISNIPNRSSVQPLARERRLHPKQLSKWSTSAGSSANVAEEENDHIIAPVTEWRRRIEPAGAYSRIKLDRSQNPRTRSALSKNRTEGRLAAN
jgi:hypothetical protein